MDKIQAFLITAGQKDLAQEYYEKIAFRSVEQIIDKLYNVRNESETDILLEELKEIYDKDKISLQARPGGYASRLDVIVEQVVTEFLSNSRFRMSPEQQKNLLKIMHDDIKKYLSTNKYSLLVGLSMEMDEHICEFSDIVNVFMKDKTNDEFEGLDHLSLLHINELTNLVWDEPNNLRLLRAVLDGSSINEIKVKRKQMISKSIKDVEKTLIEYFQLYEIESDAFKEAWSGIFGTIKDNLNNNVKIDHEKDEIKGTFPNSRKEDYEEYEIDNPTEEEQLKEIKNRVYGFNEKRFLKFKNPSIDVQLAAVKRNPIFFKLIKNPSEEVQLAAVRGYGFILRHINNPSPKVILEAIRHFESNIMYIKNPSKDLILEVMKKANDGYDGGVTYLLENNLLTDDLIEIGIKNNKFNSNHNKFFNNKSEKLQLELIKKRFDATAKLDTPYLGVRLAENFLETMPNMKPAALKYVKEEFKRSEDLAKKRKEDRNQNIKNQKKTDEQMVEDLIKNL